MNINVEKTKQIVEMCWQVACTAELPGAPREISQGPGQVNSIRLHLFQQLVAQLVPNNQFLEGNTSAKVEVSDKKEPWEQ